MHFTYCIASNSELQQGDILQKSEQVCDMLTKVHPHYLKDDYTHFIVLTQTCDLVRRESGVAAALCAARYITIAAVRPLEVVLKRHLEKFQDGLAMAAGVCGRRARDAVKRFVEHLLNNNDKEFFYLHQEPSNGLAESSCAFLRLSISVRAYEHYETLLQARVLSLEPMFRAKLGWMTGNIYSRIGTDDWIADDHAIAEVQEYRTRGGFDSTVEEILDQSCKWVDDKKIKEAAKKIDEETRTRGSDAIRALIEGMPTRNRKEEAIERVIELLRDSEIVRGEDEGTIRKVLDNDSALAALMPK